MQLRLGPIIERSNKRPLRQYAFNTQFIDENRSTENTDDNIYKYSEIQYNKVRHTYMYY